MGVVATITALLSALVPLGWALASGEAVGPLGAFGVAVALVSLPIMNAEALVGSDRKVHRRQKLRQVGEAAAAGTLFGVAWALLAESEQSGFAPFLSHGRPPPQWLRSLRLASAAFCPSPAVVGKPWLREWAPPRLP